MRSFLQLHLILDAGRGESSPLLLEIKPDDIPRVLPWTFGVLNGWSQPAGLR